MSAPQNNPPIPLSQLAAEIIRLSSGQTCSFILLTVWNHKLPRFNLQYLADCCRCDVRTLERNLSALRIRGIVDVAYLGNDEVVVEPRYREWGSIPDYESPVPVKI